MIRTPLLLRTVFLGGKRQVRRMYPPRHAALADE